MPFSGTKGYLTKPKPGVMLNPLHPLSSGLVGCWLFNEGAGSLANDISGNGNHGRLINMLPNVQGSGWGGSKFGAGLHFDGSDDYVDCGNDPSLNGYGEEISVEAIIYSTAYETNYHMIGVKSVDDDGPWQLRFQSNTRLPEFLIMTVSGANAATSSLALTNEKRYHIIGTYNKNLSSDQIKIYVNGELKGTGTFTGTITGTDTMYIGKRADGFNFDGIIDLFRKYNRALSPTEIKQLNVNPFCNLLQVPIRRYFVAAPPVGAIMNQFQRANIGADLYNGVFA